MRTACCVTKSANTLSEYVILLFHCKDIYMNAPPCSVTRTLSVFSYLKTVAANGEIYLDVLKSVDVSLLELVSKLSQQFDRENHFFPPPKNRD
jgi:hypothetical protein